jgi:hypothetical protein
VLRLLQLVGAALEQGVAVLLEQASMHGSKVKKHAKVMFNAMGHTRDSTVGMFITVKVGDTCAGAIWLARQCCGVVPGGSAADMQLLALSQQEEQYNQQQHPLVVSSSIRLLAPCRFSLLPLQASGNCPSPAVLLLPALLLLLDGLFLLIAAVTLHDVCTYAASRSTQATRAAWEQAMSLCFKLACQR